MTMAGEGMLNGCRYLLHDRDAKFSTGFDDLLRSAGIEPLVMPPRSPNLNAHLERWNRSVKEECLSKLILFGEASSSPRAFQLRSAFSPRKKPSREGECDSVSSVGGPGRGVAGEIRTRERLGGLLKFYYREAA